MENLKSAVCSCPGSLHFFLNFLCAARIWWQLSLESLNGWKALGNVNASEVLERGVTLVCVCVCVLGMLWDGVRGWGMGLLWHYSGTTLVLI